MVKTGTGKEQELTDGAAGIPIRTQRVHSMNKADLTRWVQIGMEPGVVQHLHDEQFVPILIVWINWWIWVTIVDKGICSG